MITRFQARSAQWSLLFVILSCVLWTLWLILLTVHPNATINRIMNTESYDSGSFWLLLEPPTATKIVGTLGFALVLAGYGVMALQVLLLQRSTKPSVTPSRLESLTQVIVGGGGSPTTRFYKVISEVAANPTRSLVFKRTASFVIDLTAWTSRNRLYLVRKRIPVLVHSCGS